MRLDSLSHLDIFEGLAPDQITCSAVGERKSYQSGASIFCEGEPASYFFAVLSGSVEVCRYSDGKRAILHKLTAGMSGGEVPLLTGRPHLANGEAAEPTELLCIDEQSFWQMLADCPAIRKRLLENMALRIEDVQTHELHQKKLAVLGKMAAGLAHELNNPAAAARRASEDLLETIQRFDRAAAEAVAPYMFRDLGQEEGYPFQPISDLIFTGAKDLGALECSEREDELADWLEETGLEDGFEAAEHLVSVGFTKDILAKFAEKLNDGHALTFLNWISEEARMNLLAEQLQIGTQRISELALAMKSYAHSGKSSGVACIDLNRGIRDTLIILHHKLKRTQINVIKELDASLPLIEAHGSELNQVWTNILDNAIDALGQEGRIVIRSKTLSENQVAVEIEDDGPGIPKKAIDKIFDASFTTKAPGKGTGLGLEIANKIVRERHKGELTVQSQPGRTLFTVTLPVRRS